MKKFTKIFTSVLIVLCLIPLSSCFIRDWFGGGKETLTVWCAGQDKEMITKMVDNFIKAKKPKVEKINVLVVEDDKTGLMLRSFYEGNNESNFSAEELTDLTNKKPATAGDVICMPHDQLGALVSKNYVSKITDDTHITDINKNTAPSVGAGKIGGVQYGFPSSFETHMLFYDTSIVTSGKEETLEGILSCVVPGGGFPFAMNFGDAYFSANWFFTYGCKLFGDSGEDASFCDFDSQNGIDAMTYVINNNEHFLNLYWIEETKKSATDQAIELFEAHKLGAYISGPWDANAITDALTFNYGCAKLPAVEGKAMKSFAGYKLYCVNEKSKDKNTSMDLAAWLTNTENQKTRFNKRSLIPVSSSLANDPSVVNSGKTAKALLEQGPYAIAMPSIPEIADFWKYTGPFTADCYNGLITTGQLPAKLGELAALIKK